MQLPQPILALLRSGGTLVVANARAARAVRLCYGKEQGERAAWRAPEVYDFDDWLTALWQRLLLTGTEERLLLNGLQEQAAWSRIVTPTVRQHSLLSPEGIAALAAEAYSLLADHGGLDRLRDTDWGPAESEIELFRGWARAFRTACRRAGWLSRSELPIVIADALHRHLLVAPRTVGLLGFDRVTPTQSHFFAALTQAGTGCSFLEWGNEEAGEPELLPATDLNEEIAICAAWTREQLPRHSSSRIAILVPDGAQARSEIERVFKRVMAPETVAITAAPAATLPFEFSLGMPLAQTPLVRAASLVLRWFERPLEHPEFTWLLLSGFLSPPSGDDDSSSHALAEWDAKLRREETLSPEIAIGQLTRARHRLSPSARRVADAFAARLERARARFRGAPASASYSAWAALAGELLADSGWSSTRGADTVTFQAGRAWTALLERLASLDFDGSRIDYGGFLKTLKREAAQTIFAPESTDAPVQIMGPFEASGQAFDRLWFLGADEANWPTKGRPHPLLPLWLQTDLRMPHVTPADDWQLASSITERLTRSAGKVIFSYGQQNEAGEVRPSSLVRHLPIRIAASPVLSPHERFTELYDDDLSIPWPAERQAGGQEVLAQQAACPFQAFASKRLGARALDAQGRGLSPQQRGNLLHTVLERVWSNETPGNTPLRTRADLLAAIREDRLTAIVQSHVHSVFTRPAQAASPGWLRAYLAAEQQRVAELTLEWLHYEATRADFEVEHCEREIDISVGALKLHVRADRIDRVAGGRLLLDYKTGRVSPASWIGDRPEEPQLPLYAAYGEVEELAGALFAQVRTQETCFSGRVAEIESNLFAGLSKTKALVKYPYTEELRDEWRTTLRALSESFLRGDAQVDPKQYPQTCQYCPLASLCRVAETAIVLREDPAESSVPETTGEGNDE